MTNDHNGSHHRKIRVHELAKELGVTSREILMKLAEWGQFVKSASSTLEAPLVRRLRQELRRGPMDSIDPRDYGHSADISRPTTSGGETFGAAVRRAQRLSKSGSKGQRRMEYRPGEPMPAILRVILEHFIVAQRPAHAYRSDGGYTQVEIDRARSLAMQWAQAWLTGGTDNQSDVVEWIRVASGERPDIAAQLSSAGLTPADAELRLGFGRIDESRDTIIACVIKGTLGIKDAICQVQQFRRSQQPSAS